MAALLACSLELSAAAQKPPKPAEKLESPANQDGVWITLGPVGAATRIEGEWFSAVGGELSVVGLRRHCFPALVGIDGGAIGYAGRDGGRIWLEAEVAVNDPLPFAIGLAAGAVVEVDEVRRPRFGWQATLFVFAGVVPYVRAGSVEESGGFVELGVMIKIPARRLVHFR